MQLAMSEIKDTLAMLRVETRGSWYKKNLNKEIKASSFLGRPLCRDAFCRYDVNIGTNIDKLYK